MLVKNLDARKTDDLGHDVRRLLTACVPDTSVRINIINTYPSEIDVVFGIDKSTYYVGTNCYNTYENYINNQLIEVFVHCEMYDGTCTLEYEAENSKRKEI